MLKYFDEVAEKIDKGNTFFNSGLRWGSILVHCGAGVSRVTIIRNIVSHLSSSLSN